MRNNAIYEIMTRRVDSCRNVKPDMAGLRAMVPKFLTWPIEKEGIAGHAQRAGTLDNSVISTTNAASLN
jgi:hypothetical protein